MNNKVSIGGIVVAIALGLYAVLTGSPASTIINNPVTEVTKVGAAGQDFPGPCISVNGLNTCAETRGLNTATGTICAIKSPGATSTITNWGVDFVVSTSSASIVTMAKASTAFATTTLLGAQIALAANAQAYINGSTTATQLGAGANVFAPGTFFVVSMTGATSGTVSPSGTCSAEWKSL